MGGATPRHDGVRPSLLMCPPDSYAVEYEINPWMDRRRSVDRDRARDQWRALCRTLVDEAQASIELVRPVPLLPDFVFTANAGLVLEGAFIPSRFRHAERAREEPHWRAWFEGRGYSVQELPPGLRFEGEGDVLPCEDLLVAAFGFRSDREAVCLVGELSEREVLALELADSWYYHLDTCFCPIGDGTVLYFPGAFTRASRTAIMERFPHAIPVSEGEARRFVCNSVVIGQRVVMSRNCPEARAQLQDRGYIVHEVDVSEFLKAGGGAKCLTLFLVRTSVRARAERVRAPRNDARCR